MGSTPTDVHLKVSEEDARRLAVIAEKKGITGRAPWAVLARMVLKEAIAAEGGT